MDKTNERLIDNTIINFTDAKGEKEADYILAAIAISLLFEIAHDINEVMKILSVCHATTGYRVLIESVIEKVYAKNPANVYCLNNLIKIQNANLNQLAQVINKKCADYSFSDEVKEAGEALIVELMKTTEEDSKIVEDLINAI